MEATTQILREACVGSYKEAKKAEELGANRIELCENLKEGGTTPSYGTILFSKNTLNIPIAVMIRPRGGDFLYSPDEIEIMREDILICKKIGVESVVFGFLTKDNLIDLTLLKEMVQLARPLKVVFHMAFDEIENKSEALKQLIECGVDRILTKGSKTNATDGINTLKKLVEEAQNKLIIVAGGGVTKDNFRKIADESKVSQCHGTKIVGPLV